MTRRWMAGVALVLGIAALPACAGQDDDAGSAPSSSAAAAPSSADAPASSASDAPASGATDAGVAGEEICAFLKRSQSQVEAAKTPSDAKAVLAISVATFASQNAGLRAAIGSRLDPLTQQRCPDVRAALLRKTGADTLSEAVNQS